MSNDLIDSETKQSPCFLIVFGSVNFRFKNIYFEHFVEDNQLYDTIISKSIYSFGKENVWNNDSLDKLYLQIERVEPFTEIILIGHCYNDSIVLGDNLLLSLSDEKIKAAHISKNCRVFLFSCFTKSSEQLPTYFGQINYLSDFIYRIHISVTPYELEKFDTIKLGAEIGECLHVFSGNPYIHEYISGHTIARPILGNEIYIKLVIH